MTNNFLKLINSPLLKSKDITRYSANYQSHIETLSDHITDVSMMSYIICLDLLNLHEDIDVGKVLEYAITHDVEETRTGDVVRSLKYYDDRVLSELKRVAQEIEYNYAKSHNYPRLHEMWDNSKSGKEGLIIKLTDMLSVARKCIQEVELLGNKTFLKITREVTDYLSELEDVINDSDDYSIESKSYLISLTKSAEESCRFLVNKYSNEIDRYELYNISVHENMEER